jgi:hypothetical protein
MCCKGTLWNMSFFICHMCHAFGAYSMVHVWNGLLWCGSLTLKRGRGIVPSKILLSHTMSFTMSQHQRMRRCWRTCDMCMRSQIQCKEYRMWKVCRSGIQVCRQTGNRAVAGLSIVRKEQEGVAKGIHVLFE